MLNVAAALRTVFDDYVNGGRRHVSTLTLATCAEQVEAALREVDRARDYLLPVAGSCESVALEALDRARLQLLGTAAIITPETPPPAAGQESPVGCAAVQSASPTQRYEPIEDARSLLSEAKGRG